MSEPIGVGDWVECVEMCGVRGGGIITTITTVRGVYCVEEVGRQCGLPWLALVGIARPTDFGYNCPGWPATAFRPVYRPSESLFLTRLMDVPADPEQVMA